MPDQKRPKHREQTHREQTHREQTHRGRTQLRSTYGELSDSFRALVEQELHRAFKSSAIARVEREELSACAWLGFFEAKKCFDPRHGASFTAYARRRVRGAIYDGLAELSPFGRRAVRSIKRSISLEELTEGEEASVQHQSTGVSTEPALTLPISFLKRYQQVYQLAVDYWTDHLSEKMSGDFLGSIERRELRSEEERLLSEAFDQLNDSQREVLIAVYDLRRLGDTSTRYAEQHGLHRSTVSRRHADALLCLRRVIKGLTDTQSEPLDYAVDDKEDQS